MKVVASIIKVVPVEVEIDDKWKPMEKYADVDDWSTDESEDYFNGNESEFSEAIDEALEAIGENSHDRAGVYTLAGNCILGV